MISNGELDNDNNSDEDGEYQEVTVSKIDSSYPVSVQQEPNNNLPSTIQNQNITLRVPVLPANQNNQSEWKSQDQIEKERVEKQKLQREMKNMEFAVKMKVISYRRLNQWWVVGMSSIYLLVMLWTLDQLEGKFLRELKDISKFWFTMLVIIAPHLILSFFVILWRTSDWVQDFYIKKIIKRLSKQFSKNKDMRGIPKTSLSKQLQEILGGLGPGGF